MRRLQMLCSPKGSHPLLAYRLQVLLLSVVGLCAITLCDIVLQRRN